MVVFWGYQKKSKKSKSKNTLVGQRPFRLSPDSPIHLQTKKPKTKNRHKQIPKANRYRFFKS